MKTTVCTRLIRMLTALGLMGAIAVHAGPMEDGAAHLKAGRAKEAETAYAQVLATSPNEVDALLGRGRARQKLGNNAGAAKDFDQAVKLAPKNPEVWQRRGLFREATSNDGAAALADYNQLVELVPKNPQAYALRAALWLKAEKPKAALVDAEKIIQLKPDLAQGHALKGFALEQLALIGPAAESYQKALQLDPKNGLAIAGQKNLAPKIKAEEARYAGLPPNLAEEAAARAKQYDSEKLKAAGDPEAGGLLTSVPKEAALSKEEYAKLQAQKAASAAPRETEALAPPAPAGRQSAASSANTPDRPAAGRAPAAPAATAPVAAAPAAANRAEPAAKPTPQPAAAAPKSSPAAPSLEAANLDYLHRSNFFQFMFNGSYVYATDAGDRPFPMKGGGYANMGIPILWNGDEFYYSGTCPDIVRPDRKGIFWNRTDATYLLWGKIAADGSTLQSVRVVYRRTDGSQLAMELRDLALRNRKEDPNDPTILSPSFYSQHAANSDSAEMFHTLVKICDANRPYSGTRIVNGEQERDPATTATLSEFRPHAFNVAIYRDRDVPASPRSADTPAAVLAKIKSAMEQTKGWATIQPITDARLAELYPQWVGQRLAAEVMEVRTVPAGRTDLRADGRDGIRLQARIKPQSGEPNAELQAATKTITFVGEGDGATWLDFSKGGSELSDGWKETYVQASIPDSVRRGAEKPPAKFVIRITAQSRGRSMVKQLELGVAANPEIDAKPDLVEFTVLSGESTPIRVGIANAGPDPWNFRAEFEKKSRPVATVDVKSVDGKSAIVTVKEAGLAPLADGSNDERATLRIIAEQKGRDPLERDVKILVAQEGLFVASTGRDPLENLYRVSGDGSGKVTEIDFRVFAQDPETKKMLNLARRAGALQTVKVECLEAKGTTAANVLESGQFQLAIADNIRPLNEPAGIIRLALAKEVPWDGRIVPCDFRITYPERGEAAFSAIVTVGVVTTANGPGSADWHIELDRCYEVINRFVPAAYHPKMQALIDHRKMTLGAEGLHALRNKIWNAAVELTLGEGGQGYASEAAWASAIAETLEWSQWAGDMAFGAVGGVWLGPYAAVGSGVLKTAVVSAINAYQDGQSPEDWLWENACTIPGLLEGKIVDVDTFEKLGMQSKVKIWGLFISYHFLKNLYLERSLVGALKTTGGTVTSTMLSGWLGEEVKKYGNRSVSTWLSDKGKQASAAVSSAAAAPPPVATKPIEPKNAPPPAKAAAADTEAQGKSAKPDSENASRVAKGDEAAQPKAAKAEDEPAAAKPSTKSASAAEAESVALVRSRMTRDEKGRPIANIDDVLAIMSDPSMVRALKDAPAEVQEAFSNTREAIYRQHDTEVVQYVKKKVPGMENRLVKVIEFRTPGQSGSSLNTDRDYRVCYYAGRDPHTGKEQWIEVDSRLWQEQSYQAFARATGKENTTPEEAKHLAEQLQQRAADKYDPEASPAFSDQAKVWNPESRQFESAQIVPNIVRVKNAQPGVSLKDPLALGQMYQMKVGDAHHPHEAFVQANKAVTELIALRKSYNIQGRKIGTVPENVLKGMEAVATVNEKLKKDPNRRDPAAIAEAEKTLRDNGFQDLRDFMNKMSGQFESFKNM